MFIKLHELIHLSIFEKLTSIYIFKLGISRYVLIGTPEVIHVSTVKLAFSVLFLLVQSKTSSLFFSCL